MTAVDVEKQEILNAVRKAVERLEQFDLSAFTSYFGHPHIQSSPIVGDKNQSGGEVQENEKNEVERSLKVFSDDLFDREAIARVNLVILTSFIAQVAGKEGASRIVTTLRNLGYVSPGLSENIKTLLGILPDYLASDIPADRMEDLILALLLLYEKKPDYWGFILLIRLIELLNGGGAPAVELR
jgi:hypothetical protein